MLPSVVLQSFASVLADAVYMHACWNPACGSERPFYGSDRQDLSLLRALCLEICSAKLEAPAQNRCSARVLETRTESRSERIRSVQKRDFSRERLRNRSRTLHGVSSGLVGQTRVVSAREQAFRSIRWRVRRRFDAADGQQGIMRCESLS